MNNKFRCAPHLVLLLMLAMVFVADVFAKEVVVKVIKGNATQEAQNTYFHQLLTRALGAIDTKQYVVEIVEFEYSQTRSLRLLNFEQSLDVSFTMTTPEREKEYIAIKHPLLKGMLGKRRFLVLKQNLDAFEKISISDLKAKVACQNIQWPDYQILKRNHFNVYGAPNYLTNYQMLSKGRCDYFPRGASEIEVNFEHMKAQFPNLAIVKNRMLSYPAYIYFFVGKRNEQLAKDIEKGLNRLSKTGELAKLQKAYLDKFYHQDFLNNLNFREFTLSID